jgi:hypothetical protein
MQKSEYTKKKRRGKNAPQETQDTKSLFPTGTREGFTSDDARGMPFSGNYDLNPFWTDNKRFAPEQRFVQYSP